MTDITEHKIPGCESHKMAGNTPTSLLSVLWRYLELLALPGAVITVTTLERIHSTTYWTTLFGRFRFWFCGITQLLQLSTFPLQRRLFHWIEMWWLWSPCDHSEPIAMVKKPVWEDWVSWDGVLHRWKEESDGGTQEWPWWAIIFRKPVMFKLHSAGAKAFKMYRENVPENH